MCLYLLIKFQGSSIILTSFSQERGVILSPTPQYEPLKIPPRLGLNLFVRIILF